MLLAKQNDSFWLLSTLEGMEYVKKRDMCYELDSVMFLSGHEKKYVD